MQELASRDPDALAIQYTRYDDMTEEQKDAVAELGRKGMVVVREQKRRVVGHGLLRPTEAAKQVEKEIPFRFNVAHFTKSWKRLEVRPRAGAPHPERTVEQFCVYDERHQDYGYTDAYVKKLVRKCRTKEGFYELLNLAPKDKVSGEPTTVEVPS